MLKLERSYLRTVLAPFATLVGKHITEYLFAKNLSGELRFLKLTNCVVKALWQRLDAHGATLRVGQVPNVIFGFRRKFVALFDALETGRKNQSVGKIRVCSRVNCTIFDARAVALVWFV